MIKNGLAILCAILAAMFYAINIPISKILLTEVDAVMMAAFLYLGAGCGMFLSRTIDGIKNKKTVEDRRAEALTKKELPYVIGMIVLDIIAPILLMLGLTRTNSANASLLNNFEIVATSLIALFVFKEKISKKLWLAIGMVTVASAILSFEGVGAFAFNEGSLLVLGACVCWGFENNCTRNLSHKNSEEIVVIKGIFSGLGSLIVAFVLGRNLPELGYIVAILILGFISYGLSINFYIRAQKDLGAARTSAYYAIAPFLGVALSMTMLGERPGIQFYVALVIMLISTYIMTIDTMQNVKPDWEIALEEHLEHEGDLE